MVTEPACSLSTPPTASTRVDLPAPFGPSKAVTSPAGMSIDRSRITARWPRSTTRPRNLSAALVGSGATAPAAIGCGSLT